MFLSASPARVAVFPACVAALICLAMSLTTTARAQDAAESPSEQVANEPASNAPTAREQRLAQYLSGTQFIGRFTVDGKDNVPKTEAYTIKSCEKLPSADLYRFVARIKYGDVDQEVPMDLKILWSGNTPVITLDSLWIPGMGTFDARVLIQSGPEAGRYAGTWQHGEAGGHMFGKIVKLKEQDEVQDEAKQ